MAKCGVFDVVCGCDGRGDADYVFGDFDRWETEERDGVEGYECVVGVCGRGTVCRDGDRGEFTFSLFGWA